MKHLLILTAFVLCLKFSAVENSNDFLKKFHQTDFTIIPGYSEVVRFNKKLVKHLSLTTFKYNRTLPLNNGTIVLNVDVDNPMLNVVFQVEKLMSNSYRTFPVRFQADCCSFLSASAMSASNIKKCGNIVGCPFKKDVPYYFCNFYINSENYPPLVPAGKYRLEMTFFVNRTEAAVTYSYAEVVYPIIKD